MTEPYDNSSPLPPAVTETRGGDGPQDWKAAGPPRAVQAGEKPSPNGTVFDGGFVMAQPGDPTPPDVFVMAGAGE